MVVKKIVNHLGLRPRPYLFRWRESFFLKKNYHLRGFFFQEKKSIFRQMKILLTNWWRYQNGFRSNFRIALLNRGLGGHNLKTLVSVHWNRNPYKNQKSWRYALWKHLGGTYILSQLTNKGQGYEFLYLTSSGGKV